MLQSLQQQIQLNPTIKVNKTVFDIRLDYKMDTKLWDKDAADLSAIPSIMGAILIWDKMQFGISAKRWKSKAHLRLRCIADLQPLWGFWDGRIW